MNSTVSTDGPAGNPAWPNDISVYLADQAMPETVPDIGCPTCCTDQLDSSFSCPACGYYMDAGTRLEFGIFWDSDRARWYQAHLTPSESWFWGACLAVWYPWVNDVRAQAGIGAFRTDFLLADARIIIEIDGFSNHSREADITRDRQRQRWLQAQGYQVIRFSNAEVRQEAALCARQADYLITAWTGRRP